ETIGKELEQFRWFLDQTDQRLGNPAEHYISFSASLEKAGTPFDLKYLFQTDMYTATTSNTLHIQWAYKIKRAMTLLNKISLPPEKTSLEEFKNAFTERYETREIPLATALDTETGIGYLRNREAVDSTPFLDDLDLPDRHQTRQNLPWNPVQEILYKKLLETIATKNRILALDDWDFEALEAIWDDLPDTLSTLVEIIVVDGEENAVLSHIGGSSAANLLGRFSTGDPEMVKYVQHIVDTEKRMHPDTLIAEIIHLPESRTGNVIRRAALRDYEIPYLGKSCLPPKGQLSVDDLMISVKQNRLVLRSVKHNKEVLPRLTNAHNYAADAMPVYHFLCDIQRLDMRPGIGFSWGSLQEKHMFLPRVIYKDLILSEARWKIGKEDMTSLTDKDGNSGDLMVRVADWSAAHRLPRFVQLRDSDNTLLIDLTHRDSVAMWLDTVKNRTYFILEEFLFTGACI
ncbi:MAG: lantibiotic dehydratase family protein, partial [Sinomicrobium sp.]|nr:lantibiotic dehydratase family protein [Sinomicrobium sp.]